MVKIILIILLFLILSPLILIFLPLYYEIRYEYINKLKYHARIGFIFLKTRVDHTANKRIISVYLFNLKIYTFNNEKKKKEELVEKKTKDKDKSKTKTSTDKSSNYKEVLIFIKDNLSEIKDMIKGLYDIFKPKYLNIYFLLGTYDPYYNGLILALYYTLKGSKSHVPVEIDINWTKEVFNSYGKIEGSFFVARIIWKVFKFLIGTGLFKNIIINKFKGEKKWKKQKTS